MGSIPCKLLFVRLYKHQHSLVSMYKGLRFKVLVDMYTSMPTNVKKANMRNSLTGSDRIEVVGMLGAVHRPGSVWSSQYVLCIGNASLGPS